VSYYAETNFFDDAALVELVQSILSGNLTLEWYRVENSRVRARPANPSRGLTYQDCNVGPYGYDGIPEFLRNRYSMAARGSVLVEKLPDLGYTINRRSDIWSDNVAELYEEAKARPLYVVAEQINLGDQGLPGALGGPARLPPPPPPRER